MLLYKIDVLSELKNAGYTTSRLRKEKLLGENAIQYIRNNKPIGAKALNSLCELLCMQPGDILRHESDSTIVSENSDRSEKYKSRVR